MFENVAEIKIVLAATLLLILITFFIILFVFFYQKRYYLYKKETQLLQSQFSETLLQSQIEIQEQTLQHISRELHDNLGQVASLIKINLHTIDLSNEKKAIDKIDFTRELTRQMINDIKALSVSLNSDRIEKNGLSSAIETEVERLNKTGTLTANYVIENDFPKLPDDKALILYRMVQEILNNAVKHSQAKQITISVNVNENIFILAISDNGVGFNVEEKKDSGGAGLQNLSSRANRINAQLQTESSPETGTRITIGLPI